MLEKEEKMIAENPFNTLEEQIFKSKYFCCTLKCFKNELANGIRYKEKTRHEDIAFTMELMCKAKTLLYFNEILYVYAKKDFTVNNYTIREALDFVMQTLEYLYLADKYKDKKKVLINRINQEAYVLRINKLYNWIENDNPYTYHEFLK